MNDVYLYNLKFLFLEQIEGIYYTDLIILTLVVAIVCFVPGYILHVKRNLSWKKVFLFFLILTYLGVIFILTILRRDVGSASTRIYTHLNLGFTKTKIYSVRQTMYSLMNILLFVPWGLLIGLSWDYKRVVRAITLTTLIGFITSSFVEIMQLVTRTGRLEVTDLFTNTVGTFVGAIMAVLGAIILKGKQKNEF
ncbi:MAG: VanZ family protein [Butyrivibrio sp.]|nr:VanZ family protein [Butyrivibrio sp.]